MIQNDPKGKFKYIFCRMLVLILVFYFNSIIMFPIVKGNFSTFYPSEFISHFMEQLLKYAFPYVLIAFISAKAFYRNLMLEFTLEEKKENADEKD